MSLLLWLFCSSVLFQLLNYFISFGSLRLWLLLRRAVAYRVRIIALVFELRDMMGAKHFLAPTAGIIVMATDLGAAIAHRTHVVKTYHLIQKRHVIVYFNRLFNFWLDFFLLFFSLRLILHHDLGRNLRRLFWLFYLLHLRRISDNSLNFTRSLENIRVHVVDCDLITNLCRHPCGSECIKFL